MYDIGIADYRPTQWGIVCVNGSYSTSRANDFSFPFRLAYLFFRSSLSRFRVSEEGPVCGEPKWKIIPLLIFGKCVSLAAGKRPFREGGGGLLVT